MTAPHGDGTLEPPGGHYARRRAAAELVLSPSELYHENSRLTRSDRSLQAWIGFVNSAPEVRWSISQPLTELRNYSAVELPRAERGSGRTVRDALLRRRSAQQFTGESLPLISLAELLLLGDGVAARRQASDGSVWSFRTAPSGGALYPVDTYCVALRIDSLASGLYFYQPNSHSLARIAKGDFGEELAESAFLGDTLRQACACIALVGVFRRSKFKYGERAYRFTLLEAGHIAQNMLLAGEGQGLGTLPVGGFVDDELNRLLGLDGVEEAVLYLIVVGRVP